MTRPTKNYRIFLASPGDVQREREATQGIVNEANRILEALLPEDAIRVELIRWETNVAPQIAHEPQPVVNEQIGSYDIFLGILSTRFGTPTSVARSGTEEEFRRAHESWRKHGAPWVAFYFNTEGQPPEGADYDEQWQRVKAFKAELSEMGIYGEYNGAGLFMSTVLPQLLQIIGILIRQERQVERALSLSQLPRESPIAGQPVPIGKTVTVVDIGDRDACYHRRDKYIGHRGKVLEAQRVGDWLRGTFLFDAPLVDGDDGRYSFLQFDVAEAHGEGEREQAAT